VARRYLSCTSARGRGRRRADPLALAATYADGLLEVGTPTMRGGEIEVRW
jgi:hypothetical protein